ncbi:hypothetical protein [Frondihabitans australicus]|uniref:Uncharacterized protein n=1 Tax=Frondihabitans australicus TaxID=386892 RepID=A0A495IFR1_9MICO|nr:hypothetical protein [Frondihabitans australicus]RKR74852.1 hypothetical protein C8E83_1984 [Frondihabitans australicus]
MSDTNDNTPDEQEPATGFDQTNGLAGDLVGQPDDDAGTDDDAESDIGSIYTGKTPAGDD